MTTATDTKRSRRQDLLADLDQTVSLLERLTAIVERDVTNSEFPTLMTKHLGLAYLRVAETASRLAGELHITTH